MNCDFNHAALIKLEATIWPLLLPTLPPDDEFLFREEDGEGTRATKWLLMIASMPNGASARVTATATYDLYVASYIA